MWTITVYVTVYTLCWMASIILVGLMIHYMRNKPLGMQTSLDEASIDVGITTFIVMTLILIIMGIGAFTDGISYALALTLHLFLLFGLEFLFANYIINIWHRYLIIFRPALMLTGTDQEIIKVSRCIKVGMTYMAFSMDMVRNVKMSGTMFYLTKSSYET